VGGVHPDVLTAQKAMTSTKPRVFTPNPAAAAVYNRLFALYRTLHDAFGTQVPQGSLAHIMKELLAIQRQSRPAL